MPHITEPSSTQVKKELPPEQSAKPADEPRHNDLKIDKIISKSKFTIYQASDKEANKKYAMKVFPYKDNGKPSICYRNERRFNNLDHQNIIKLVSCIDKREATRKGENHNISYILYELAEHGDLNRICCEETYEASETMARTLFKQVIEGLEYLHSQGVCHLDLKPANLLLDKDFKVKICDFDGAHLKTDRKVYSKGTNNFRAPELKNENCENPEAADVYSAGIVLFAMTAGNMPYLEKQKVKGVNLMEALYNDTEAFWKAHDEMQGQMLKNFSEDFKKIFEGMTRYDPSERMTIEQIKASAWYNGKAYDDEELKQRLGDAAKAK